MPGSFFDPKTLAAVLTRDRGCVKVCECVWLAAVHFWLPRREGVRGRQAVAEIRQQKSKRTNKQLHLPWTTPLLLSLCAYTDPLRDRGFLGKSTAHAAVAAHGSLDLNPPFPAQPVDAHSLVTTLCHQSIVVLPQTNQPREQL